MRFYKDNKGMVIPFEIVQGDGTTAKNLTGLTVTWVFVKRDGTQPTDSPLSGTITDAANGLVSFTILAGITATVLRLSTRINMTDGGSNDEDTDKFDVDIDDPTQR